MTDSDCRCPTVLLVVVDAPMRALAAAAAAPIARVIEVSSAEQALAELDKGLPDLILIDPCMPGMDGLELCRRLRANDSTCDLPVLMLIEKSGEQALDRAYQAGVTDFVDTPVAVETLRQRVRYLLRAAAALRELRDGHTSLATAQRLAYRDTLTGLPNRRLFADRLERALEDARQTQRRVAVLHLDIDRFKTIKEGFGNDFGNQLLQQAAERLASCLRVDDTLARGADEADPTLSRLAGDEFMVVLSGLGDGSDPGQIAGRLLETLARPFRVDQAELLATGSIGVAIFPDDGECCDRLIERAGTALAHAKAQGGNCHLFYSDRMNSGAASRLELASRLRKALAEQAFELTYQPICNTASGRVASVEALLRWDDPTHGPVSRSRFVQVAEQTGLILPLGELVIERACKQWRHWLDAGVGRVVIAIDLSARQFRHAGFVDRVRSIVDKHGVDPRFLRFEITDGVLMRSTPGTVANTEALRTMGIGLSVDDFGIGYSSLRYLRRFPADVLKIDRSFLEGVPENQENCSLVSAIIAMAHKLRLGVVAEGIENEAQLRFVGALDCESVQGPLLGKAMLADEIEPLLRSKLEFSSGSSVVPFRRRAAS